MSKTITQKYITEKINGITVDISIKCHSSNFIAHNQRTTCYIVVHYSGNEKDVSISNAKYFSGGNRDASAQLFVDDTNINQIMRLTDEAWHCGTKGTYYEPFCRNANSIGIEMCCTAGNYKVSEKTKNNTAHLVAYLCELLDIKPKDVNKYLLRHYDVTHKYCPAQMAGENNAEWKKFRNQVKKLLKKRLKAKSQATVNKAKKVNYKVKTTQIVKVYKKPNKDSKVVKKFKAGRVCHIVKTKKGFGKLKSGKGWVKLKHTKKVKKGDT